MINLFEYQNKVDIQTSLDGLERFLDEIWNSRIEKIPFKSVNGNDKIEFRGSCSSFTNQMN